MSLGLPEILLIFVLALLLFGPRKLPEIGRTLGRAMNEFRRAADELKTSLEREVNLDISKDLSDLKKDLRDARSTVGDLRATVDPFQDLKSSVKDLAASLDPRRDPGREAGAPATAAAEPAPPRPAPPAPAGEAEAPPPADPGRELKG
jgi:TatA/E family protein of Tat protein translocase